MEDGRSEDTELDKDGLDWLLNEDSSEEVPIPMDTNIPLTSPDYAEAISPTFTREQVFTAVSQRDTAQLHGLLDFLRQNKKTLTSPEFTDEANGKTALLKALLSLKDGKNDTIEILLDIAEKTGDLRTLINSAYKDSFYKGQTALHVAIERRSFNHVKLLVQKGADIQAKANGRFFQRKESLGFYFGELPLSLAACTNQPDIISFLMDNSYRRADVTDQDSQGNTVLHALVIVADNSEENTEMIGRLYDQILVQHHKLHRLDSDVQLEEIKNNNHLCPLQLAAKLGKIGLFKHMLDREFVDEETRSLSRKFTEWVYGPVRSSLYQMSDIDTNEEGSVLEIIVFGSQIPNRPQMLQIEPLRSLLQEKWERFASKIFLTNFLVYMIYLSIFTAVACFRKDGQPPFPIDDVPLDYLRCFGEVVSVLGAVWFLYKSISILWKNALNLKALFIDGFSEMLFFLQAVLLLVSACLYLAGLMQYVGLMVLSLALAWYNVLYYSRGSRTLGMYSVTMQRMILGDLLIFLCVYVVLLFGFSAAFVTLRDDSPIGPLPANTSGTRGHSPEPISPQKAGYNDLRFTIMELFKFTIGMGDLQFTDNVESRQVFYLLLITYIIITYILLLNMLIALMGHTVDRTAQQSEDLWNLQRAFTILDMERTLPGWLRKRLHSRVSQRVCLPNELEGRRRFFRVQEMNWSQWRSNLHVVQDEDPAEEMMKIMEHKDRPARRLWNFNLLMDRIYVRRHNRPSEPELP